MCSPTAGRNCVCKVSHQRNKKGVRCCSLLSLSFTHSSKFIHSLIHCLLHLLTHFFTPSFSPVSTGVVQVADPANQPRDALWFIFEDDVQVRTGWKVVRCLGSCRWRRSRCRCARAVVLCHCRCHVMHVCGVMCGGVLSVEWWFSCVLFWRPLLGWCSWSPTFWNKLWAILSPWTGALQIQMNCVCMCVCVRLRVRVSIPMYSVVRGQVNNFRGSFLYRLVHVYFVHVNCEFEWLHASSPRDRLCTLMRPSIASSAFLTRPHCVCCTADLGTSSTRGSCHRAVLP